MLERLWTSILELVAQVVTPDWGVLVSLIPVAIAILVVVVLVRLFLMLARAPKAGRGKGYVTRKTPAGIHMPGPSFAPIFAGVGLFLVMLGLVFGGVILLLGVLALVLTLLYWLREGLRLVSAYHLPDGTKLWIITEADRSATTILLPDEY